MYDSSVFLFFSGCWLNHLGCLYTSREDKNNGTVFKNYHRTDVQGRRYKPSKVMAYNKAGLQSKFNHEKSHIVKVCESCHKVLKVKVSKNDEDVEYNLTEDAECRQCPKTVENGLHTEQMNYNNSLVEKCVYKGKICLACTPKSVQGRTWAKMASVFDFEKSGAEILFQNDYLKALGARVVCVDRYCSKFSNYTADCNYKLNENHMQKNENGIFVCMAQNCRKKDNNMVCDYCEEVKNDP